MMHPFIQVYGMLSIGSVLRLCLPGMFYIIFLVYILGMSYKFTCMDFIF